MKRFISVAVFSWVVGMGCATSSPSPSSQPPTTPSAPEMEAQVTSLRSTSGIHVQLMRWGAVENEEALLFFSGFDHPWTEAGKPIVHKVQPCRHGKCYSTEVNGQRWTTLLLGEKSAELYLPFMSEDRPTSLSYAPNAEGVLTPEALAKLLESPE